MSTELELSLTESDDEMDTTIESLSEESTLQNFEVPVTPTTIEEAMFTQFMCADETSQSSDTNSDSEAKSTKSRRKKMSKPSFKPRSTKKRSSLKSPQLEGNPIQRRHKKPHSTDLRRSTRRHSRPLLNINLPPSLSIIPKNNTFHSCIKCPGYARFGWQCIQCFTYHANKSLTCSHCNLLAVDWICGCNHKCGATQDPLIGTRVSVYWADDNKWRQGVIENVSLPSEMGTHNILYDGDKEAISEKLVGCCKEVWKVVK